MTISFRQPFRGSWPITQRFGEVVEGVTYKGAPHTGIDYGCPEGTQILASAGGQVMAAGWAEDGFGFRVIIRHSADRSTLYAHLSRVDVTVGQTVEQSQQVGLSGSTGYATGPHLHFEARRRWNDYRSYFDPMTLPLQSFADAEDVPLKDADAFAEGNILKVTAPLGAKGFSSDHFDYFNAYPQGTEFYYTGLAMAHNGYTYMRVIPMTKAVWMAVHDGETQILDRVE